jgi:hypothetical protein
MRTFFGHRIEPLQQRVIVTWLYPRPSDHDRSFSEELSNGEIDKWILKVLDHGANLNPGASPASLREGVASTRVSLLV